MKSRKINKKKLEELTRALEVEKGGAYSRIHAELGWVYTQKHKDADREYMENQEYDYEKIFAFIPSVKEPLKILDIGTTPFTIYIKEAYPHYEVTTLDLTNLWEDICQRRGVLFLKHDLSKQPFPFESGYFDVVIFSATLEHIFAPPTEILKEIHRIIAPGGNLIFTVAHLASLINRLKLLIGITPLASYDTAVQIGKKSTMYGHIREYTMQECINMLNNCNFTITKKYYLQPSSGRGVLPLLYDTLSRLIPSFGVTIFITCRKALVRDEY
jgi:SAM-dependent methyltransferase